MDDYIAQLRISDFLKFDHISFLRFGLAVFPNQKGSNLYNEGWIYLKKTLSERLLEKECGLKPGNGTFPSIANCFKDEGVKTFFTHHAVEYCQTNDNELEQPRAVICA